MGRTIAVASTVGLVGLGAAAGVGAAVNPAGELAGGVTRRVSVSSAEAQGDGFSGSSSISADGRYVAFSSDASNLVAGDTNAASDVFVRDRRTGATRRVSVSSAGAQPDGFSGGPSISADGRYVAFESLASNLVAGDTNAASDVFVRDRKTGVTQRVSVTSGGAQAVAPSYRPSISADGRYVAFGSDASSLVAGDTNAASDVFVRDRRTGATRRVSVSSAGAQGDESSFTPSISADGRYVAFSSSASNLVAGDTNAASDVFVRDRKTGVTRRVSVSSAGAQGDRFSHGGLAISADGRYVAFGSEATNLVAGDTNAASDVFVRDRKTGATRRVSVSSAGAQGDDISFTPSISADGRYVAFESRASNLVAGDTNAAWDVFLRDRRTGVTRRVSVSSAGAQGDESSSTSSISADGRYVAFGSDATNLVAGDTNGFGDVFVRIGR